MEKKVEMMFKKFLEEQKRMIGSDVDISQIEMGSVTKLCPFCLSESLYNYQYDAYYCERCNIWLEPKCEDDSCEFCKNRPLRPL
ncbi:hypothetical protein B0S90_0209 [Caldicellulosiruptor bescii]|uniref:Uncharacterized protein n=2 Tax=Caldicellulosiruptor bescii TaxID=31899 RepID=B9MPY7_CALBD|nr:hypothetical protein [Caldicellulosiruptor bescii]ACM61770.1 hypothetical protein Athe_2716 [Caldicellulosiruptor bescii DSM 6725]PBC88430.1 hypothetical protein B0S87_1416 [Caldicellulosiruptor bescii]PBC92089.1 hypothetical protein B0S89_2577 [Caldicellulosiruptor bescii]PBD05101.1 hypothetical protein B0S85_2830 [Caldicellulosiruptor bescii]PBD05268.1 hypothetical protein B0S90_0209 [Caldicellulosiruptor bescii]